MNRPKEPPCFVNESRIGTGFLKKEGGMRILVSKPREADKYQSREDAKAAGEHFGRQPYYVRSYSSVQYLNDD